MKITRPIIFFDIEATGTDTTRDRIVELGMIKSYPDGHQEEKVVLVNPGIKISAEVIAIHGITNEAVATAPSFKNLAPMLLEFMEGCDFGGFGITRFDIPLLIEEFKRCEIQFPRWEAHLLDGLTIFHRKEPRDLTAAVRFYCNEELQGAHGAKADCVATAKVLLAQLERYQDLPLDVAQLAAMYAKKDRFVDPTRKLRLDDAGQVVVNFGQHRGTLLADLAVKKRDYLEWMLQGDWHPKVKDAIKVTLEKTQ